MTPVGRKNSEHAVKNQGMEIRDRRVVHWPGSGGSHYYSGGGCLERCCSWEAPCGGWGWAV